MPVVLNPGFSTFLLAVYHYGLTGVPYHQLTKGIKALLGYEWLCMTYNHYSQAGQL